MLSKLEENKFKIIYLINQIYIVNYNKILNFNDQEIIIEFLDKKLFILGNNLIITKLLTDEIMIKGEISKLEFR